MPRPMSINNLTVYGGILCSWHHQEPRSTARNSNITNRIMKCVCVRCVSFILLVHVLSIVNENLCFEMSVCRTSGTCYIQFSHALTRTIIMIHFLCSIFTFSCWTKKNCLSFDRLKHFYGKNVHAISSALGMAIMKAVIQSIDSKDEIRMVCQVMRVGCDWICSNCSW